MDGYNFVLRLGGTSVTGRTSSSLNMAWDIIDATTADSSQNEESIAGTFHGSFNVEGKLKASDTYSATQLKTAGDARTNVACLWGRLSDDARRWSCNVLIENLTINAPVNDHVTWTATLRINGALSEGTYTTTA